MADIDLTAERLRELLRYSTDTGEFVWLKKPSNKSNRVRVGSVAGYVRHDGYVCIRIDQKLYLAQRLAVLHVTGMWPNGSIDHIDGNTGNNSISNLRDVAHRVNLQNQHGAKSGNHSGFLGVSRFRGGWRARIMVMQKETHIGVFSTPELAHKAYLEAKRRMHVGCTI